jgi:hypothetical protein
MTPAWPEVQLSSAPGIYWRKVAKWTIVVDEPNRRTYRLSNGPQIIWTCLALSYSYTRIVQTVSELLKHSESSAEEETRATLMEWHKLGLINKLEGKIG